MMSWESLETSISSTLRNILTLRPNWDITRNLPMVNPELPKLVSPLMSIFGSCVGRAKARFPNASTEIEKMEKEARAQFEIIYGVQERTHANYVSILNVGIQKISEVKEYIKTLEKMQIRNIEDSIPKEIREDFSEACICYANECYNASAVMCRRAIGTIAFIEDSYEGTLYKSIEKLAEKGLERSIIELAHEIRLLGNVPAAHRDRVNMIRSVTRKECEYLIEFLEAMLNSIYVRPNHIQRLRENKIK